MQQEKEDEKHVNIYNTSRNQAYTNTTRTIRKNERFNYLALMCIMKVKNKGKTMFYY